MDDINSMIILTANKLLRKNVTAMALFPFILLKSKDLIENKRLINHEKIHLRQQLEMLIIPFYIWYVIEFLIKWVQYQDRYKAYREISFEKEAYAQEHHLAYLKNRKIYAFWKYL